MGGAESSSEEEPEPGVLTKIAWGFGTHWAGPLLHSLRKEPEPGDLIEISRGLYSHWGVYVGDGNVVHLTTQGGTSGFSSSSSSSSCSSSDSNAKKGLVKKELLSKVVGWGTYRINNKHDEKYSRRPVEEIVREAEATVGKEVDYSLMLNNCEHFATKLRYGVPDSKQVEAAITVLMGHEVAGVVSELRKME